MVSPHLCLEPGHLGETLPGVEKEGKPELVLLQEMGKGRDESACVST